MTARRINRLPVVDDGRLVGIVTVPTSCGRTFSSQKEQPPCAGRSARMSSVASCGRPGAVHGAWSTTASRRFGPGRTTLDGRDDQGTIRWPRPRDRRCRRGRVLGHSTNDDKPGDARSGLPVRSCLPSSGFPDPGGRPGPRAKGPATPGGWTGRQADRTIVGWARPVPFRARELARRMGDFTDHEEAEHERRSGREHAHRSGPAGPGAVSGPIAISADLD